MTKYIGITVGPINETLTITSSPLGLWSASYLFSYVMKEICKKILEEKKLNPNIEIISPYLEIKDGEMKEFKNDAGIFHDRIFFRANEFDLKDLDKIFKDVKKKIGENIVSDVNSVIKELESKEKMKEKFKMYEAEEVRVFIDKYIQLYAIEHDVQEDKNVILEMSSLLDALELNKSFISEIKSNPLLQLFEGLEYKDSHKKNNNQYKNLVAKKSFLMKDSVEFKKDDFFSKSQFAKLKNSKYVVKNLDDIVKCDPNNDSKINSYYAIIQADGDNMGKVLENISGNRDPKTQKEISIDDGIKNFSQKCFEYTNNSVNKIKEYGGIIIYAGGDDLLFIAPLLGTNNINIFELCDEISVIFEQSFQIEIDTLRKKKDNKGKTKIPSISFGVSINYYKYPLYESFKDAIELLFVKSKNCTDKNAISVRINKHSGQNLGVVFSKKILDSNKSINEETKFIENKAYEKFKEILKYVMEEKKNSSENVDEGLLSSIIYKIFENRKVFEVAISNDSVENVFRNYFDKDIHSKHKELISKFKDLIVEINKIKDNFKTLHLEKLNSEESIIETYLNLGSIIKFFVEKKGGDN